MSRHLFVVAIFGFASISIAADDDLFLSEGQQEHSGAWMEIADADLMDPLADGELVIDENDPPAGELPLDMEEVPGVEVEPGESFEDACCDGGLSQGALRFGVWGVTSDGSPNKVGEFQDLESSPFWDVDVISSDGVKTWDIVMSGLDNEANDARLRHYAPGFSADVQFQRYLRRLDHDPLTGYDANNPVPPGPNDNVISDDLNVGEDYAIRVQELDARFQGRLSNHLKWRMKVWSQRKFGERQANATAHCFNNNAPAPPGASGNVCHVLSQRQQIDWVTAEVEPAVEAQFDHFNVEYARTMRTFGQDDGVVDRMYTRFNFSPASGVLGPDFNYAIVPDSITQIDRLKIGADLSDTCNFYGNLYLGDTENKLRDTNRQFSGFDLRLTDTSICGVKLVGYANKHVENNELPPFFFNAPPLSPANGYDEASAVHPVDYDRTRVGVRGNWQPFYDPCSCGYGPRDGLTIVAGYEYYLMARDFAVYDTALGPFIQQDTKRHQIEIGPWVRWSCSLDTHLRYRARFIEDPLLGVREASGGFNTNQPEQEHELELGGTWAAAPNCTASAQVSVLNRWHDSDDADFVETDYPFLCSVWYAPTCDLSFTAAYGYFSNAIDQDITLGFTTPNVPVPPLRTETTRWDYEGYSHLVSLHADYAWSECVQLICGYEWVYGSNTFDVPPSPAGADWSLLPVLSDVVVETNRVTAGVDWQPYSHIDVYFRYVFYDWDDISGELDSGTTHMALAGASIIW